MVMATNDQAKPRKVVYKVHGTPGEARPKNIMEFLKLRWYQVELGTASIILEPWEKRQDDNGVKPRSVIFEPQQPSVQIKDISLAEDTATPAVGWRRFNYCKYHQSSIVSTPAPETCDIKNTVPFNMGQEFALRGDYQDTAIDSVRIMAEECDRLERFLVVVDTVGYWGGLSSEMLNVVRDDLSPSRIETFGIFESGERGHQRGSISDVIMNIVSFAERSDRFLPLLLSRNMEMNLARSSEIACMMETFVTEALFTNYLSNTAMPFGLGAIGFGTANSGLVPQNSIKNLSVSKEWSKLNSQMLIGRADNSNESPDYFGLSAYHADPENASLSSVSALLAMDFTDRSSVRKFLCDELLIPLRQQHSVQQEFSDLYPWKDVYESLERLANPPILE